MNNNFQERDPKKVRQMFSKIAPSYDRANRIMCFGLDQYWRRVLAKKVVDISKNAKLLDAACGSGDVSKKFLDISENGTVIGIDFCKELLDIAKLKCNDYKDRASFIECDCSNLKDFKDESFDAITIAFGFRNFQDRKACLKEFNRVLKKGGKIFILEVSHPRGFEGKIISFFMEKVTPILAYLAGSNKEDYVYLAKTAKLFPHKEELEKMFKECNFIEFKNKAFLTSLNSVSISEGKKE